MNGPAVVGWLLRMMKAPDKKMCQSFCVRGSWAGPKTGILQHYFCVASCVVFSSDLVWFSFKILTSSKLICLSFGIAALTQSRHENNILFGCVIDVIFFAWKNSAGDGINSHWAPLSFSVSSPLSGFFCMRPELALSWPLTRHTLLFIFLVSSLTEHLILKLLLFPLPIFAFTSNRSIFNFSFLADIIIHPAHDMFFFFTRTHI